jgi:hyaluronan synthase
MHTNKHTEPKATYSFHPKSHRKIQDVVILLGAILLMIGATFLVYQLQPYFQELHMERMNNSWGIALIVVATALLIFKICFLGYILVLYLRYRSIKSVSDEQLPLCTVIVPAYNEGEGLSDLEKFG